MSFWLRGALTASFLLNWTYPAFADVEFAFDTPAKLLENSQIIAQRPGRFFVITLKTPHQILSTSVVNGGQTDSIDYLVNHQSMEARGDQLRFMQQITMNRHQYHQNIAEQLRLPADQIALMGTAANMQQLAQVEKQFGDLSVTVFATAGVKGNAQRAGDPTQWYQDVSGGVVVNRAVPKALVGAKTKDLVIDNQGTINIIVLINRELVAGAQTKISLLATEAKSAALSQLVISSKSSPFLATGTGTDQLIIASPINTDKPPLPSASGHLKLGELVGSAVREAVLEALVWQNGLVPSSGANVFDALGRYGLTEKVMLGGLQRYLSEADYILAKSNLQSFSSDSRVSAAAYAYASLLDRLQFGNLPSDIAAEALLDQASQTAVAVAGKPSYWPKFWKALSVMPEREMDLGTQRIDLFVAAVAQGWAAKWPD